MSASVHILIQTKSLERHHVPSQEMCRSCQIIKVVVTKFTELLSIKYLIELLCSFFSSHPLSSWTLPSCKRYMCANDCAKRRWAIFRTAKVHFRFCGLDSALSCFSVKLESQGVYQCSGSSYLLQLSSLSQCSAMACADLGSLCVANGLKLSMLLSFTLNV